MDVLKTTFFDLLEQVVFIFCSKGIISLKHDIEQDSKRPHICVNWRMISFRDYFRSHVGRSTTESINYLVRWTSETETKVNQLQLSVTINQDVLCLDIPVNDVSTMKIKQGFSDDQEKLFCLVLR